MRVTRLFLSVHSMPHRLERLAAALLEFIKYDVRVHLGVVLEMNMQPVRAKIQLWQCY